METELNTKIEVPVLWIVEPNSDFYHGIWNKELFSLYRMTIVSVESDLNSLITLHCPRIIVFDFDYPGLVSLKELQKTKLDFPQIPILMLSSHHSESLAIWAFRNGVRDYFIKPIDLQQLSQRMTLLSDLQGNDRQNILPRERIPEEYRCGYKQKTFTVIAKNYIERNLHESINLEYIAKLCGMSRFKFSRTFREENGETFRDYLLHCRVKRAMQMLQSQNSTITDVALSVGYQDLSHFIRVFKRIVGEPPSAWKHKHCDI